MLCEFAWTQKVTKEVGSKFVHFINYDQMVIMCWSGIKWSSNRTRRTKFCMLHRYLTLTPSNPRRLMFLRKFLFSLINFYINKVPYFWTKNSLKGPLFSPFYVIFQQTMSLILLHIVYPISSDKSVLLGASKRFSRLYGSQRGLRADKLEVDAFYETQ